MNQKLLTVGIAGVVALVLIAGWAIQKKRPAVADNGPSVDKTLTISDNALDGFSPQEAQPVPDSLLDIGDNVISQDVSSQAESEKSEAKEDGVEGSAKESTLNEQQSAPSMEQKKNELLTATLHTEKGDIVIVLNNDGTTPKTVENFVTLAKKNFYTNTVFHRTIKGFMIQGGDPKGDGTGGPGYTFADEPFDGEYTRGIVAMANAGPNTNGSQFFIMHADYALPKSYVIFGKVIKGMDVVDQIATAPTTFSPSGESSKPVTPVRIKSVEIGE